MKILVVDDSWSLTIAEVFRRWFPGAEVETAETGDAAIEKVRNNEYLFVTMDGNLGVMSSFNGPQTVAEIRKFSKVPIVMMSSSWQMNDAGVKYGANVSFFNKLCCFEDKEDFVLLLKGAGIIP